MLITRPQPGADATARRVAALGLRPVVAPVLAVVGRRVKLPPLRRLQAILVTSANALEDLPRDYFELPLFAVGRATAARAGEAGFNNVRSADADAQALAALVVRSCTQEAGSLLLACGEGQGMSLAGALRQAGFRVIRRVVYAAGAVAELPDSACRALRGNDLRAALFFSPATARAFVSLLRRAMSDDHVAGVEALAISEPTAAALRSLPWCRIRVASRPNQDELLAMLT